MLYFTDVMASFCSVHVATHSTTNKTIVLWTIVLLDPSQNFGDLFFLLGREVLILLYYRTGPNFVHNIYVAYVLIGNVANNRGNNQPYDRKRRPFLGSRHLVGQYLPYA